jgi:hypothetical protein
MGVDGAGYVSNEILMFSPGLVGQKKPAVHGDPPCIRHMGGEFLGADKSVERQLNLQTTRLTQE